MRAAIVFVLAMLSAVATPAAAEWTSIAENPDGDQFFIDLATLKIGTRSKAWFMTNYSARTKYGDLSDKSLREVDCSEGKIRFLAGRFYTEPMGLGSVRISYDEPSAWWYVTPMAVEAKMFRIMCPFR